MEWHTEEAAWKCFAVGGNAQISNLVDAIHDAKTLMGHSVGGSFQINEFGQVLVPSTSGRGEVMIVGEAKGAILWENPMTGGCIDLSSTAGLTVGAPWQKPYIGHPYNLSQSNTIYHYNKTDGTKSYPAKQDIGLIKAIRAVRRTGSVRFIVNMHGIVLTKVPVGEFNEFGDTYEPVYIGRINERLWFEKEEDYYYPHRATR